MDEIGRWLTWMFGQDPPGELWVGGHGDKFKGRAFGGPDSIGRAAEYATWLDGAAEGAGGGVYFRLTPLKRPELCSTSGRGAAVDSSHLVAFGADLDLAGPGHKPSTLPRPETHDELVEILKGAGLPEPSAWVHSGGGRYAFWRLAEPLVLDSPEIYRRAVAASAALHDRIIAEAARRGFKIDNTRDLARVYRLPGTFNRKGAEPFCAHVMSTDGPLYSLSAVEGAVAAPSTTSNAPPGNAKEGNAENGERALSDSPRSSSRSSLFGPATVTRTTNAYTRDGAMAFVAPALNRLAAARDGEINVRLNDAAMTLAHFGEDFWSREAAETQLYAALESTEYDGVTWQASGTIESAYAAMAARGAAGDSECWRATLITTAEAARDGTAGTGSGDVVDALLAEMLTAAQAAAAPPPRPLVHGLLQFDSESWLIGEPGAKKSFVALDLAAHVARGMTWQRRRVEKAVVVMIVAEGAGGTGPRIKAWESKHEAIGEGLYILPRPVQAKDGQKWAVLAAACARLKAGLVILDTQARVTVGLEENSATDMGLFVDAVRVLREATRACVLTVHHTGRRGGDARGSSAIDGAQTTELKVSSDGPLAGRLSVEKQKDIEVIEPIELRFERLVVGQSDDGEAITSLVLLGHDQWRYAEHDAGRPGAARGDEPDPEVTPFALRTAPQSWTHALTSPVAGTQRWLLQALADAGRTRGLTQSEWRDLVATKLGKLTTPSAAKHTMGGTAWREPFQAVTDIGHPAVTRGVVVKASADRWTVDPVALEELED